jgi:dTDP-4-amino-4,6-dideoxygalactose transaminase
MATSDAAVDVVEHYTPGFGPQEVAAVAGAIESGWVSYVGPRVTEFEGRVADVMGFPGSVAMSSGTCALQVAFEILNAPGTEVLMPALTFAAPASAIVRAAMSPLFIDVTDDTCQLDVPLLRRFIATSCQRRNGLLVNTATGRRISTICAVHLWGGLADLDALHGVAAEYGLDVVHDAAQCLGARYRGRSLGSVGELGEARGCGRVVAITSFNANKIVTTGGGGAFLAQDIALVDRARHLSSTAKLRGDSYTHDAYGLNYRMSNLNAALGLAQLAKLEDFIERKCLAHRFYEDRLSSDNLDVRFPALENGVEPNYWVSCARLPIAADAIIRCLQSREVQARPVWVPLPYLPIYSSFPYVTEADVSRRIWHTGILLPSGPTLTRGQLERVLVELRKALRQE